MHQVAAELGGPRPRATQPVQHCSQAHVVCRPGKGKGLGSRGKGSWLKTESLEEQVLLASPLEGEKGPKVRRRSRYCKEQSWSASGLWDRRLRVQVPRSWERAWGGNGPYLFRDSQQDLVQRLHQLLKSGPLRGRRVPALPHQPVPGNEPVKEACVQGGRSEDCGLPRAGAGGGVGRRRAI